MLIGQDCACRHINIDAVARRTRREPDDEIKT